MRCHPVLKILLAGFVVLPCLSSFAQSIVEVKDIAAGPEDILSARVRLPDPASSATTSWTALLRHDEITPSSLEFIPGEGKTMAAILAADVQGWTLAAHIDEQTEQVFGDLHGADALVPGAVARVVTFPLDAARIRLSIESPASDPDGWILIADGRDELKLRTHLGSHGALIGTPVSLHAGVEGGEFLDGEVRLVAPDGRVLMHALGGAPTSLATFTPDQLGDWTVQTLVRARDLDGHERMRTTQQIMRVVRPELTFTGEIRAVQDVDGRIGLEIPVSLLSRDELAAPRRVAIGCEVWGRMPGGPMVPVCWVARMQQLPSSGGASLCGLRFDSRWIELAGVDPGTIELRELRAHSAEGFVMLDHDPAPALSLVAPIDPTDHPAGDISPEMRAGHSGEVIAGLPTTSSTRLSPAGHVLMISHGYCTDQFPWRVSDFSGDLELYEEYGANVSHDEFALRFESRGRNFKSMGIAGHSQGGNAAAHLFTFYWSALDWPSGSRRIQGVGVPWQGTALAGNAAVLGEVFGVGCGTNYDMTYEGSAAWLSFIPTWVREDVWYWTTSFTDGWFYDYCQIVTDVLLSDPDDGTVERYAGQLDGANNGGHKTGWCHTRLMRDPPQCKDAGRNVELSSEAAR